MRPLALASAAIRNRRGSVPKPAWCTFLVTYRCNARCRMCDSWRMDPGVELTPEQVTDVFHQIGRLDVVRVSGGEPFVRQDLGAVAEAIVRAARPTVLHISTNGSFPERVTALVEGFAHPKLLRFMVSFDGLAEEHDRNRGRHVTFARAFETVRRLAELRAKHGLRVSVNHTVISSRSLADNVGLRHALEPLGVDVHAVLAYADSAMYGAELRGRRASHLIVPEGYPLHPALADAGVVGFVERELARVRELDDGLIRIGKRYYLRGLLARLRHEANPRPKPRCVALRSHIRLLPDGSIPVCQFNTESIGRLPAQSFEEVWRNGRATALRKWVDACPGCWAECEVIPNAIYSGDLLHV
jgi:MoaA/NifB/PqqE/SkfB family radical SAM enzyme